MKLRDFLRRDISSGRMECSDDDLLSLSYLMIINEINSKSPTTKVDMRYFYLASHWEEMNNFPWVNDSFMTTIESARKGILNGFNQVYGQEDLLHQRFPNYTIGKILLHSFESYWLLCIG